MWRRWRGYVPPVRLVRLEWPDQLVGHVFSYHSGPTSQGGQGGYDVRVGSPRPSWAEARLKVDEALGGAAGEDEEAVEAGEVVEGAALVCRGEAPHDHNQRPAPWPRQLGGDYLQ